MLLLFIAVKRCNWQKFGLQVHGFQIAINDVFPSANKIQLREAVSI